MDILYDGNDTIYHLSTGTAAIAGMVLKPYVMPKQNPVPAGGVQENIAEKAAMGAGTRGTLTGNIDGLTANERAIVEELLASGKDVEIIPRSNLQNVKTPDFLVDGVKTELKTLEGSSLNTPVTKIQKGFKQGAEIVIIDGRNTGVTLGKANTIINRAVGTYGGKLPGIVEIWTADGIIRR